MLNPKYNDTAPLCKKIRGSIVSDEAGDIFGTTVRNKRHGVEDISGQEYCMGGYTRWFDAYLVTLTDRCSFLCVSGQRGTIAIKSRHEKHLCVVALTSWSEEPSSFRLPLTSSCDLLLLLFYFQVNTGIFYFLDSSVEDICIRVLFVLVSTLKAALYTIDPRSPYFALYNPKYYRFL